MKKLFAFLILFILCGALLLNSCALPLGNSSLGAEKNEYTVAFDTDGGMPETGSVTVEKGGKLSAPVSPEREGYVFLGWFYNGERWDFSTPVKGDMTLQAGWEILEEDLIYKSDTLLTAVYSDDITEVQDHILSVTNLLSHRLEKGLELIHYGDAPAAGNEIVFGSTSRSVSVAAFAELEKIARREDEFRYLIYSDGSSVAVIYDESAYGLAVSAACEWAVGNLVADKLILPKGVVHSGSVSLADFIAERDEKRLKLQWDKLEFEAGKEIAEALRELYGIYDVSMVEWFAELYDPAVGGYYYSNSARDNAYVVKNGVSYPLLPDIESTAQALGFISSSGLADFADSGYSSVLPDEMKQAIVAFLLGLQQENGFFYHPQWTKAMTDGRLSRRARDLGNAVGVLSELGFKPYYDTPTGVKGNGAPVNAELTYPLGASTVTAVSRVVATAGKYDPRFENAESFRAYLASLDIRNNSYAVGNELTSQAGQINTRDKTLASEGKDYSLMDILIEWLNENQNPETGHWDYKKPGDSGYSEYYGVNGLMKISGIYNAAGAPIPNIKNAAMTAMNAITSEERMGAVVDLYNTWFALSNVRRNLAFAEGGNAAVNEIFTVLEARAPEAIRVSREKILDFKKPDGSFSYTPTASSATSQGMPVAISGSNEGDVNATVISSTGLIGRICAALGVTTPSIFGETEWRVYEEIVTSGGVSATERAVGRLDFNTLTELPEYVATTLKSEGAYVGLEVDSSSSDKAIKYVTTAGKNDSLTFSVLDGLSSYDAAIFEADLRISSSNYTTLYQIYLLDGEGNYAFMINLSASRTTGRLELTAASSNGDASTRKNVTLSKGVIPINSEFRIGIEYRVLSDSEVRINVYIDGTLALVTDCYYNCHKAGASPLTSIESVNLYSLISAEATVYVDNVTFKQINYK